MKVSELSPGLITQLFEQALFNYLQFDPGPSIVQFRDLISAELFYGIVGISDNMAWNIRMINSLERRTRGMIKCLSLHSDGGTGESQEILRQDSRRPGGDSKRPPPEYKSRASLLHHPARSSY